MLGLFTIPLSWQPSISSKRSQYFAIIKERSGKLISFNRTKCVALRQEAYERLAYYTWFPDNWRIFLNVNYEDFLQFKDFFSIKWNYGLMLTLIVRNVSVGSSQVSYFFQCLNQRSDFEFWKFSFLLMPQN